MPIYKKPALINLRLAFSEGANCSASGSAAGHECSVGSSAGSAVNCNVGPTIKAEICHVGAGVVSPCATGGDF